MPYDPGSPPRRAVENEAPRSRQPPSWENRLVIHRMRGLRTRASSSVLCLALVTVACGGGEPSLTDYVDQMNAAVAEAEQKAEALTSSEEDVSDFTPQVLEAGLLRGLAEIRIPLQTAVDDIEAPEQIADLHDRLWAWHRSFIEVEQALADRAATTPDTTNGWTGLSDSPEMGAYRSAIAKGKQLCISLQSQLDATEARGVFADEPWLPEQMKEVVTAALGCRWFPEDPSTVYLYPPPGAGY